MATNSIITTNTYTMGTIRHDLVAARRLDRDSTGRLWMIGEFSVQNDPIMAYSEDDGATWNLQDWPVTTEFDSYKDGASIFIDKDDWIWVACLNNLTLRMKAYTWSGSALVEQSGTYFFGNPASGDGGHGIDLMVFNDPVTPADKWACVTHTQGSTGFRGEILFYKYTASGPSIALSTTRDLGLNTYYGSADFEHTGDGKTVQGGSSMGVWHVANVAGVIKYQRYPYPFATGGTLRTLVSGADSGTSAIVRCNGSKALIGFKAGGATEPLGRLWYRDYADTTTTSLANPPNAGVTSQQKFDVAHNGGGDKLWLGTVGPASDFYYITYDFTGAGWDGSWTLAATSTLDQGRHVWLPHAANAGHLEAVYTLGVVEPNSIYHSYIMGLNEAPTAPTWTAPADGSTQDVDSSLLLDWTFNDPDAGDTQSAFSVKRTIGATTTYWNGTTWQASEDASTKIATATTSHNMSASWGSDGDADHYYSVKTWDAADAGPSPWSSTLRVIPSAKDNPTITAPTPTGTPTVGASALVEWTVTTQTKYRVVVSDTTGGTMDTGTLEYDSGIIIDGVGRSQTASFPTNSVTRYVKVQTWNDEGLASTLDEVDVSVTFTPPATPTLVNSSNTPAGAITVTVTNPGTGSAEDYNDIYRREGDDATTEIRVATGVAVDGAFIDYTPRSGVAYKYLAKVFGTNGSTADSTWTL